MPKENIFQKAKGHQEIKGRDAIDTSEKRYEKIGNAFALITKEISDLSVPEKTLEDWGLVSSFSHTIDDKLDKIIDPAERLELSKKIISSLKGDMGDFSSDKKLEQSMLSLKNLSANLPEVQRQSLIDSLASILKITEKLKNEENPHNLVRLTRIEGQIAARLYMPFFTEEFRMSEKYPKILHALTRLSRAGNSFDDFTDLPDDYKNGEIKVHPTVLNRLLFLGAALSDGLSMLKDVGFSKKIIKRCLQARRSVVEDAPSKQK